MLARRGALKLEIAGMRHSTGMSVSKLLKDLYGYTGNKERVLEQYEADLRRWGVLSPVEGSCEPPPSRGSSSA